MRQENIPRLTYLDTNIKDPYYLHFKFLFEDVKAAVRKYAKGDILDIGCGNKPYEPLFQGMGKYVGCDVIQSSSHKVDILCLSTAIPLPDEQFDTVFCTQVMEHVEDHQKMLGEAYRLLRKGGKIILSVPMAWEHHEVPYDFFRFTKYGLTYVFEKAGFKILEIKSNGGKWALLGQMSQNIIRSSIEGKKSIFKKLLYLFYRFFFKYIINLFYIGLEKLDKDEDFVTLNFVIVAERPA